MKDLRKSLVQRIMPVCMWLSGLGLLATTGVALWIGFQDLFLPVSLAAQFFGLAYFLAGLTGLAGVVSLADLARPLLRKKPKPRDDDNQHERGWGRKRTSPPTWQIAFVFGAAVAGCYVDVTVVWYSVGYQMIVTWTFIVLAVLCFFLACVMLPAIRAVWKYIAGSLKGLGISAAVLALAAQFWYVSVYAPENTPAAVNTTFTISSVTGTGSNRFAQIDLTMEDTGSVPAVALGSIVVVNGIGYQSSESKKTLMVRQTYSPLMVQQPYSNDRWLFPNNTVSDDFVVPITESWIKALNFKITFEFARTTWLTLGQYLGYTNYVHDCMRSSSDQQSKWYVVESYLRKFAQGTMVLYSDYCKYPEHPDQNIPFVRVGFMGVRSGRLVAIPNQSRPGLGVISDFESETILLG